MKITQARSANFIYVLLWLLVLAFPVFTLKGDNTFNWDRVFLEWFRVLPFLLIFFFNNNLLAPKLLFRQKLLWYSLSILSVIILFSFFNELPKVIHNFLFQYSETLEGPMHHRGTLMPNDPRGHFPLPPNNHNMNMNERSFSYLIFENIIISFLVVGFNNAIKLGIRRQKEELQREENEKIHLETELSFLRQQISPHFFMNTLNNIHALIEIDQTQAQKSVIELSKLMRYLLNESQQGTATIKAEMEFLNSYIDLMRIRYSDKVKIDIQMDISQDQKKIPSLLFISLVENAFKYGISYTQDSYISIHAKQSLEDFSFEIKNSISPKTNSLKGTGVGLVNLRKQLDILFDGQHVFEITKSEKDYHVKLIIPLHYD
ncbi:sensor histidine kinase [Labilibaculum sp.]|uniref:sensor histidine kinase n=1 Tax=Labilibaculum sp. TaxID=2060723 RepID=UPI00356501EA